MPSPFPGMDPYVEAHWNSVHVLMMAALAATLKRSLPPGLVARPEESVRIESLSGDRLRDYRPDEAVVDIGNTRRRPPVARGVAVAEPIDVDLRRRVVVTRNVLIVDVRNADRVVTAIEVLSPGNKSAGQLNDDYRAKIDDYEAAGSNWVEIDLLRSRRDRMPVPWDALSPASRRDYVVLTYRATTGRVSAYPIGLRDPLPTIAVPLRPTDDDAPLDLRTVFNRAYDDGPFSDDCDYARPPDPPLADADAAWAAEVLRQPR